MTHSEIKEFLPQLSSDLIEEIVKVATIKDIPADTEILREGQYVKVVPIVIEGLIKVFTRHEDKELLLYYIKPHESCIMSFACGLGNIPSNIYAWTEEDTKILMLPADKMPNWTKLFPDLNNLFYQQYNVRYIELLDTIHHVMFDKMDARLYAYLKEKSTLTEKNPIKISHRQIATDLGTAREVISRVMKKLETEGKVKQQSHTIEIL